MRIAILCDKEKTYREELNSLKKEAEDLGNNVTLIFPGEKFHKEDGLIYVPYLFPVHRFPRIKNRILDARSFDQVKSLPFDLVHSYGYGSLSEFGFRLAQYQDIPYLFTFRLDDFGISQSKKRKRDALALKHVQLTLSRIYLNHGLVLSDREGREQIRSLGYTSLVLEGNERKEIILAYEKAIPKGF